ncbi:MAG: hypothetical protein AAF616_02145 [Bacteroidota bacterium]
MKKLLAITTLITGTLLMVSCGDDDEGTPDPMSNLGTAQEVLDSLATVLESSLITDASASGYTTATTDFAWTANLDGQSRTAPTEDTVMVSANITADATWTSDRVYQLTQRIIVTNGATLTIDAGTVIAGQAGNEPENAAALMIARDGTLNAVGTAQAPIVFTSTVDNGSVAVSTADVGLWGGLVVLGEAPVSADTENPQIEGVPSSETLGQYGGSTPGDNSGSLAYISIRHGGSEIFGGSEINGLTLGGVGSGTSISWIHIYANDDDGVEFFGGTVDLTNLYVEEVTDDAIDIDQSYAGTVSKFWVAVNSASDEVLEIDGREGSLDDTFTLMEGVATAVGGASITSEFKSQAKGAISNFNSNGGLIKLVASFASDDLTLEEDAALNAATGDLTFTTTNATFRLDAELSDETEISSSIN